MSSPKKIKNPKIIKIMRELKKRSRRCNRRNKLNRKIRNRKLITIEKRKINKINDLEEDLRIETVSFKIKKSRNSKN